ncbi:GDSL-type esterase/lipase family protein [Bacillus taeanensis]|uniref:GDSL family lipase n=1 Tax=Bacillus taeanensis TaxID=273032 RepID=A0A366XQA2_9BACI|nr:GDSL-type esterase/lipase family protein [Bacillus taeanensis]RBW67698.1 GDSL family lipase [Bacillus taeanensis]
MKVRLQKFIIGLFILIVCSIILLTYFQVQEGKRLNEMLLKDTIINQEMLLNEETVYEQTDNSDKKTLTEELKAENQKNEKKDKQTETKEEVAAAAVPSDITIVGLGDSLTKGVGDRNKQGYIGMVKDKLTEKLGNEPILKNYAVNGNRTDQLIKVLRKDEVKESLQEADYVFITIGGNDILKVFKSHFLDLDVGLFQTENKDYERRLHVIMRLIQEEAPNAQIYFTGLFNPFFQYFRDIVEFEEVLQEWNESSQIVLGEYENTHFVSISSLFETYDEQLLYKDNFHPNERGYELIANAVYQQIMINEGKSEKSEKELKE